MWIDTHAHLFLLFEPSEHVLPDRNTIKTALGPVLKQAEEDGVNSIICPGIDLATSELSIAIAECFPGLVWAAVGIHPNSASQASDDDWQRIAELVTHPRVVAIGETGLDWFRDYTPREQQVKWFERHLELSQRIRKPIIVHCRDAEEDMTMALEKAAGSGTLAGVMHACAAGWDIVKRWLDLGMFISFAGSVTFSNKKHLHSRRTAQHVPLDRLLIETDSPFLTPEPLRGRVQMCVPSHVILTGEFVARLRGIPVSELAEVTASNAVRLFRLA